MLEIQAIVFDAFGTLCEITAPRRPFAQLAARHPDRKHAREMLMTRHLTSILDAAIELSIADVDVSALEADLKVELASVRLYPEVIPTLLALRDRGFKLAVASNLALPYAEPLLRLLPLELDACAWSFDVGHTKPSPQIFSWICERLELPAHKILMVGDTIDDDYRGAIASGLQAIHLCRNGRSTQQVPTLRTLDELIVLQGLR